MRNEMWNVDCAIVDCKKSLLSLRPKLVGKNARILKKFQHLIKYHWPSKNLPPPPAKLAAAAVLPEAQGIGELDPELWAHHAVDQEVGRRVDDRHVPGHQVGNCRLKQQWQQS